jgi:hypothetical protein
LHSDLWYIHFRNVFLGFLHFNSLDDIENGFNKPNHKKYVRTKVFTAVTVKNTVFWDKTNPVRTSQKTHYVSATEPRRLILRKF